MWSLVLENKKQITREKARKGKLRRKKRDWIGRVTT